MIFGAGRIRLRVIGCLMCTISKPKSGIAARILGKRNLYADAKLTRYINLVGQSLAQNCNRPELFFHFAILDSAHINAYSTPGGYVFITLGAIRHMNDEAELAAVLAHEIAHITRRHIVKELNIHAADTSLVSSLSVFLGGSSETAKVAFLQAVDQAVSILFSKGYKIQDELDADRTAMILLANSGYDPIALQRYLTRIKNLTKQDATKTPPTTHPSSAQRMLAIKQLIYDEQLTRLDYPNRRQRFIQYVDFH
jgi:predicted Zn-dependent protease